MDVGLPSELLDEIREDLRHEGTSRCDRWFPEIAEGAEVFNLNLIVGLAWWTVALPIIKQARVGSRILVLDSPRPEAVGKVGTLRSFGGFPCVDLHDGTLVRPLVRQAALLPGAVSVSQPVITDPTGTPALGLTNDPLAALRDCLAFSSRDWSQESDLAWLYGIVLGWDDPDEPDAEAMQEVAARFGWDAAKVARLRTLRAAFGDLHG